MTLQERLFQLQTAWNKLQETPRIKLYNAARAVLDTDVTPKDRVPDEVACAEVVSTILNKVTIVPHMTGTYTMYTYLRSNPRFEKVTTPLPGDIIISPTGMGNRNLKHGHVGIVGVGGAIMSNSSHNGKFEKNYTLQSWYKRFGLLGGMPLYYFRLK